MIYVCIIAQTWTYSGMLLCSDMLCRMFVPMSNSDDILTYGAIRSDSEQDDSNLFQRASAPSRNHGTPNGAVVMQTEYVDSTDGITPPPSVQAQLTPWPEVVVEEARCE